MDPEPSGEFSSSKSKSKNSKKRIRDSGENERRKEKKSCSSSSSSTQKSSVRWSADNITTFLSIIREAVISGKVQTDSGFKKKDWCFFTSSFQQQTGLKYDQQQLQSKLSSLKSKFAMLKDIKALSGMGWDRNKCLPDFPEAEINNFCAGTKKKYRVMFTKKLDDYDLLQDIFPEKHAQGLMLRSSVADSTKVDHNSENSASDDSSGRDDSEDGDSDDNEESNSSSEAADDDDEDVEPTQNGLDTIVKVKQAGVSMRATPGETTAKAFPVRKETKPQPIRKVYRDEAPTPVYLKKQTEAILMCKQMADFKAMVTKERIAVTKAFVDDATGGVANWFLLMEEEERVEYIKEIASNVG